MISTLIGLAFSLFGGETIVYAAAEPVIPEPEVVLIEVKSEKTIKEQTKDIATEYGVSFDDMWRVIQCESGGSTTIQSRYKRPDGTQEQSYGLAQIYLPAHKNVTKEDAINPGFALRFMAENFKAGRQDMWSCW